VLYIPIHSNTKAKNQNCGGADLSNFVKTARKAAQNSAENVKNRAVSE
jgi:hypothetical protein